MFYVAVFPCELCNANREFHGANNPRRNICRWTEKSIKREFLLFKYLPKLQKKSLLILVQSTGVAIEWAWNS
jgi:hypothetical protein